MRLTFKLVSLDYRVRTDFLIRGQRGAFTAYGELSVIDHPDVARAPALYARCKCIRIADGTNIRGGRIHDHMGHASRHFAYVPVGGVVPVCANRTRPCGNFQHYSSVGGLLTASGIGGDYLVNTG